MRLEHRQIDIRQHRSMLEIIQVHVEAAAQIMALCGAPNWLAAESVSGKLRWMPLAQR